MADHLRLMEELLRIPIVDIENAIVVPAVLADQFELKPLLDFISNNSFFGLENDDPHSHIKRFYQITRTFKINQVHHDVVKLILFPLSLKGAAETWLENEPPNSITTWDDLVSKFLNRFYPHSKTRELRKEIMNFQQVFGETFTEAWERFKDLLRKCPHHALHQIDFFYNRLSQSDQDSLNTAAGGNLMSKNTQEALTIIENKAKVRTCRNKPQVSISGGSSIQNDAITALTKQVETLSSLGVLPSNTVTDSLAELNVITSMDGLTLDGSFTPHSNLLVYQEKEQESEAITEVVEVASSKSTPLVPPLETPPLSTPKPKKNLKPNPHQPSIPYPSRLQEEIFQALKNPTRRADHFIYRIDIVDSLCDKFPIENNSMSGNPTPSSDSVIESTSPSPIPCVDSDSLMEETDILLSNFDDSPPEYETFSFDIEEKSSGSTTTHSDFSLSEYDLFIFDLLIDPLPPANRSDFSHEEFADELAHIISPPEYDYFYFDLEADPGEFTSVLEKDLIDLSTKEFTSIELNNSPLLLYDCDSSLSKEFSEIDLLVSYPLFLTDSPAIDTLTSFPSGNKDKVFNLGILTSKGFNSQYSLGLSHWDSEAFKINKKFKSPMEIFPFLFFLYYEGDVSSLDVPLNPFVEIPSGEIKVHIEVLSVLWGNRLPIPDGSLPLSRLQDILRVTAAQLQLLSDYYCWKDYADRDEIKDLSEKR
ncbi:reverse transcriptase domain-containing protein [Tanacetum coccineum]|uniref:Reverse transcriptase domain-containing protein n=1 Tax=Tanacetum coccineum TaxID=301880 RepID=A0ABQ5DE35_9ASTR